MFYLNLTGHEAGLIDEQWIGIDERKDYVTGIVY